jgi:hypothetical protein
VRRGAHDLAQRVAPVAQRARAAVELRERGRVDVGADVLRALDAHGERGALGAVERAAVRLGLAVDEA